MKELNTILKLLKLIICPFIEILTMLIIVCLTWLALSILELHMNVIFPIGISVYTFITIVLSKKYGKTVSYMIYNIEYSETFSFGKIFRAYIPVIIFIGSGLTLAIVSAITKNDQETVGSIFVDPIGNIRSSPGIILFFISAFWLLTNSIMIRNRTLVSSLIGVAVKFSNKRDIGKIVLGIAIVVCFAILLLLPKIDIEKT